MTRKIVAILGVAGSGKTLVARHLVEAYGFQRTRFAGPLKNMLKVGLGLTDEQVDGNAKMEPLEALGGATPRHLMQSLGHEWGRRMIHPDLWATAWKRSTQDLEGLIVADDLRYPNEAQAVRDLGGVIWRVYRPGLATMEHGSERAQNKITEDALINNATSIADMIKSVDFLAHRLIES
jgi:hypothetical protein